MRVRIRPWAAGDGPLLQRLLGDADSMRFLGGAESLEAVAARHERYLDADPETHGLFAIEVSPEGADGTPGAANAPSTEVGAATGGVADDVRTTASPVVVGWVGFWESEWSGVPVWEIGWHVLPEFQGRGIATRATRLALESAGRRGRHRFVDAFPSVDNGPSNALCTTVGFALLGGVEVEYPKGSMMRTNHWRFDLATDEGAVPDGCDGHTGW